MDSITPINEIQNEITAFYNVHERFPVAIEVNADQWQATPPLAGVERIMWCFRGCIPVHPSRTEPDYHLLEHFRTPEEPK